MIFAIALFSVTGYGDDAARDRLLGAGKTVQVKGILPVLFEVDRQEELLRAKKSWLPKELPLPRPALLPHRVYLYYYDGDKCWYYVLTNFSGKVVQPLEFLRFGTVLPGRFFGASRPDQNYEMTPQGIWVPTFQKEQQYIWTVTQPPWLKTIEFVVLDSEKGAGK
jgi:hypothetical protein